MSECPREPEVVNAVLSGAWASIDDEELKAHAAYCETCGEVAAITALLREDNEQARREVPVPAAGQIWWRAAVRARLERTQAATQPMTLMHGITAAIVFGVLLAVLGVAWPMITGSVGVVKTLVDGMSPSSDVASAMLGMLRQSLSLALLVAAGLIITPLVVFFAIDR